MMPNLAGQRCFNHAVREAVAKCPACSRYYCRECITEHDDRVICAACLKGFAHRRLTQRSGFIGAARLIQCLLGVLTVWLFFYFIGEGLLALPASFHEGTLWQGNWLDKK